MIQMKINIGIVSLVATITLSSITACNKNNDQANSDGLASNNRLYKKIVRTWVDTERKSVKGTIKKRFEKLSESIDIEHLTSRFLNDKEKLLFAPLGSSFVTYYNRGKDCLSYLAVTYDKENGISNAIIIQCKPDAGKKGITVDELVSVYNNKGTINYEGKITFLSLDNKFICELGYKQGKLSTASNLTERKKNAASFNASNGLGSVSSEPVYTAWYLVTTYYYTDGSKEETREFLGYTCDNCGGGNSNSDELWYVDSGDYNELPYYTVNLVTIDDITKLLTDPCLLSVVNGITDASFKNQIVQLFRETYVGNGFYVNLKFTQNSDLYNADGSKRAAFSTSDKNTGTWIIELNPTYGTKVSKEFWGSVIIHELAHSFLSIYMSQAPDLKDFNQHEIIFQRWINQISDFLQQSYGMNLIDANALALGGLDDVLKEETNGDYAFKQAYDDMTIKKYGITLADAEKIRADYKEGVKGEVCK